MFIREATKPIETEFGLDESRKMLKKTSVETALRVELGEHLGCLFNVLTKITLL